MYQYTNPPRSDELWHFGILGMKWGVRRYQNKDGSLTPAGEKRYNRYDHLDLRNMSRREKIKNRERIEKLRYRFPHANPNDLLKAEALENERAALARRNADWAFKKWSKEFEKIEDVKGFLKDRTLDDEEWAKMNEEIRKVEDEYLKVIGFRK